MSHREPSHYKEAVRDEKWVKAMNEELDALEENHTWEITDLPAETSYWMQMALQIEI